MKVKNEKFAQAEMKSYENCLKDLISCVSIFEEKSMKLKLFEKVFKIYGKIPKIVKKFEEELKENSEKKLSAKLKFLIYEQSSHIIFKEEEIETVLQILKLWYE